MAKRSPAFQFYVNDFLGSPKVQAMSATEVGAYVLLLLAEWNATALPSDTKRLAAIARMTPAQFDRVWRGVLGECFFTRGGKVYNARLEQERKKQAQYRKIQQANAAKRWQSDGNAIASRSQSRGNALLSSSSSSNKKTRVRAMAGQKPEYSIWECPHVERCSDRAHCEINTTLDRPRRQAS